MTSLANQRQAGGDHYRTKGVQHWDLMADNEVPYLEGQASKYGYRWPKKNGAEDLDKFRHFVEKILEKHEVDRYVNHSLMYAQTWRNFCDDNQVDALSTQATTIALVWKTAEDLRECLGLIDEIRSTHYPE